MVCFASFVAVAMRAITFPLEYCPKVMQAIIAEYRALFSRFTADKSGKYPMKCEHQNDKFVINLHYITEISFQQDIAATISRKEE